MNVLQTALAGAVLCCGVVAAAEDPGTPPVHSNLEIVSRVTPMYPRSAVVNGISGFVEFEVIVGIDGAVKDARPVRAEPRGVFEKAAIDAIRKWQFKPKVVDGKPVESKGIQRVEFVAESLEARARRTECEKKRQPARGESRMSEKVFRRMESTMGLVQRKDYVGAEQALLALSGDAVSPLEKAGVQQALGYTYAQQGKTADAIAAYRAAQATAALSWDTHDQMTLSVVSLLEQDARKDDALRLLETYFAETCSPPPPLAERLRQGLAGAAAVPQPKP